MSAAVVLDGVVKRFGAVRALDGVSLEVTAGTIFGLLGSNGAGKTTGVRILATLTRPDAGTVEVHGHDVIRQAAAVRRLIGVVGQYPGVDDRLTGRENLALVGRLYGGARGAVRSRAGQFLEQFGLASAADRQVRTYSGGMRRRLDLAAALVGDPEVLLLDEPASGLDPRARVEMRELLRELGAMGKTIVVSSHILAELAELCDSVGIIEKGRLVAGGPLDEIRRMAIQGRMLHIKTLSDREQAQAILRDQPGVGHICQVNGSLEVEFMADGEAMADLLETLLREGVRVVAFHEIASDLEEVFLRLTKGEVA